jgi:cytoskeleton protein RodZ
MPPTPFGERLKRERELRGVSLDEVSGATKINTKYLEALETEQWDRLPHGFFARGFIRTIARYLGMNEDSLISEYALVTKDHPTVTVWVQDLERPRKPWKPIAVAALFVAILAAGGWLAAKRWGHIAHTDAKARVSLAAPMVGDTSNALPTDSPASTNSSSVAGDAHALDAQKPTGETSAAPPAADQSSAAMVRAANAIASTTENLELRVQAARRTRVRVTADGHLQFSGWLAAGGTRTYSARESFQLSANDSSAIFIELNGKTMPPLGTPGHPGHATLTRQDLGESSGGLH